MLVKPGDAVKAGQNVVAIETDKAAVDVPAEVDGTVEAVHVKPGDKVPVGGTVLTLRRAVASARGERRNAAAPRRRRPSGRTPSRHDRSRAPASRTASGNGTGRHARRSSPPGRPRAGSPANSASASPR